MTEFSYSLMLMSLIGLSIAGLIWANTRFAQMTRILGPFGYWGMAIPTTRLGMSAAMTGVASLGLASLPPRLLFYPDDSRSVFLAFCMVSLGFGFLHDLVSWLDTPEKRTRRRTAITKRSRSNKR